MDKVLYIVIFCVMLTLFSSVFRKKNFKFKQRYDAKISAYRLFTDACKQAVERCTVRSYKELNATAHDTIPIVDDPVAKELVEKVASMTERQYVYSINKDELREACAASVSALSKDLYSKPKKDIKNSEK